MDVAAKSGGGVGGDAEGEDGDGNLTLGGLESDTRGAAFKGEVSRTERAGAFGEDSEGAARTEEVVAAVHGVGVTRVAAFGLVFVADDGDAGEEQASEKILLQLCGNHEGGERENGFVDPAVDGAVTVECDDEGGTGKGGARGKDVDARKVDTDTELRQKAIPEIWHEVEFTMAGEVSGE